MDAKRGSAVNLAFVTSTDREKPNSETRKLIRSHVMRGKNRVKLRRKRQGMPLGRGDQPKAPWQTKGDESCLVATVPRLLGTQLAAIPFADIVEPALIADVVLFSTMSSKAMFVLDPCMSPDKAEKDQAWFAPMLYDAAYLYTVCFTVQNYFDVAFARTRSVEALQRDRLYYAKTMRLLQDRLALDDDGVRLSDSTIRTVLALSGHAYTAGDYDAAFHHNKGLLSLVSMRGVDTLFQDTKLLIEILRCDLCMAIDAGLKPVLIAENTNPWPFIPPSSAADFYDGKGSIINPLPTALRDLLNKLHPDLAAIFATMSTFCALINTAASLGEAKMTEKEFLWYMGSIMYPLAHQSFDKTSIDEAFRIAILAFSSPIFLHWNRNEFPDRRFTSAFREALSSLDQSGTALDPQEHVWLLTVAALSMAHEPDGSAWIRPRLQTCINLCGISTWDCMRDLLSSILWIGLVYDGPGKEMFEIGLSQCHDRTFGCLGANPWGGSDLKPA